MTAKQIAELKQDSKRLDRLESYLLAYLTDHHIMVWDRKVQACLPSNWQGRPTLREAIDAIDEPVG